MGVLKLKKNDISRDVTKNKISEIISTVKGAFSKNDIKSKFNIDDEMFEEERMEKRTVNGVIYKRKNGAYRRIISSCPVFFRTKEGDMKEILNELADNGDEIVNIESSYSVKFDKRDNNKIFELSSGDKSVVLRSVKNNGGRTAAYGCRCEKDGKDKNIVNAILEDGTKIQYIALNDRIKENIVIEGRRDSYEYMFVLETGDLKVEEDKNNKILLKDPATNETKFIIPAPFMYDAKKMYSDEVSYEVEVADGELKFKVTANANFINAENRAFPVIIDPQIMINSNSDSMMFVTTYWDQDSDDTVVTGVLDSFFYRGGTNGYYCDIIINKNKIINQVGKVKRMALILNATSVAEGYFKVNDTLYEAKNQRYEIDITNVYQDTSVQDVVIHISADTATNNNQQSSVCFITTGVDAPMLIVDGAEEVLEAGNDSFTYQTTKWLINDADDSIFNDILELFSNKFREGGSYIEFTIPKSMIERRYGSVRKVKLRLTAKSGATGYFECNNSIYSAANGVFEIDLTNMFNKTEDSRFVVPLYADINTYNNDQSSFEFYTTGNGAPKLYIESEITNHYYKSIGLPDNITEAVDLVNNRSRILFPHINSKSGFSKMNLSHVYVKEKYNEDIGFGKGFRLNISDKVYSENGHKYYTNSIGDKYLISVPQGALHCFIAEGIKYSEEEIEAVKNNATYNSIKNDYSGDDKDSLLPVSWIEQNGSVRGFNKFGDVCLIINSDGYNCLIFHDSSRRITEVTEGYNQASTNSNNYSYSFSYSSNKLISIIDKDKTIAAKFTYSGNCLQSISYNERDETTALDKEIYKITLNYYSTNEPKMTKILSTNGHIISLDGGYVKVQSTLTQIPDGQTDNYQTEYFIMRHEVFPSLYSARVTDKDGNFEYFKFTSGGSLEEYYQQVNGVIVKAERYDYLAYEKNNMYSAKYELLGKKDFSTFTFEGDEYVKTQLNDDNNVIRREKRERLYETAYIESVTVYNYNSDEKLLSTTTTQTLKVPGNSKSRIIYTNYTYSEGRLIKTATWENGKENTVGKNVEEYVYDSRTGGMIKKISYIEKVNSFGTISKEFETETVYDGTRVASVEDPFGNITSYTYIGLSDITDGVLLPSGKTQKNVYNTGWQRVSKEFYAQYGIKITQNFEYDHGECVIYRDDLSQEIGYLYDSHRRLKAIKKNGQTYKSYIYEESSDLKKVTEQDSCGISFEYAQTIDSSYMIRKNGQQTLYRCDFDKNGMIISETDSLTQKTTNYTHDLFGNVTNVSVGQTYEEEYEYNVYGDLINLSIDNGGSDTVEYVFGYDSTIDRKLINIAVDNLTIVPRYDVYGRNTGKTIKIGTGVVSEERFVYNFNSSCPNKTEYSCLNQSETYIYDEDGRLSEIVNGSNRIKYYYDYYGRLLREDNSLLGESYYFYYDKSGNILWKETTEYTTGNFSHSTNSDIRKTYTYSSGLLTRYGSGQTIYYDNYGRPTNYFGKTVQWTNGKISSFGTTTFGYDGKGRRISKNSVSYVYDSFDRLQSSSDGMKYYYDHTGVVAFKYLSSLYVYKKDMLGNIVGILDSNGNEVVKYVYDAWGNHAVLNSDGSDCESGIGILNPFRYRGYFYDIETGLYYLQTRYYDPEVGRFISPDSIDYADPETINGLNLYAYCGNNPIMYVDPSGHFAITTFLISLAIGTLISWGLSEIFGSQIAGGISSTVSGGAAIYTGIGLLSFGPIGWIAGGALILIGVGTMAFGVNEIVAGATGTNYIQRWTGMSDGLYNGLYIGLNIASDIGTIAGNMYMKYNPRYPGNNPNRIPDGFNDRVNQKANYYNPKTGQSLHPDLQHPAPINPHWDWKDSNGVWWRLYRFFRIKK